MVPTLENCDVSIGGWVMVLRCLNTRLMVSDLQSWTDPYLDAPQVYWKKSIEPGEFNVHIQPVTQYSKDINQFIYIEIS